MTELREFSKIAIFKDTYETRVMFGPPIDPAKLIGNPIGINSNNPHYVRLVGTDEDWQSGWRQGYPDLDTVFNPGALSSNQQGSYMWKEARNFILNPIGTEENIASGYNLAPSSSGTAIIFEDKLYVGNTQTVSYTGIVANTTDVTVSGNFTGVANGTKVVLSTIGTTGLSTSTAYYVYSANGTSCKLSNNSSSYTAITSLSGSAGSGTAYLTPANFDYGSPTTFAIPAPALTVGDYIFWGDDPNNLKIGGKIVQVYTSGTEYNSGARYRFEKDTKVEFPVHASGPYEDEPIPQEIYYYRKNWNGKGIKNDILTGFYLVIGVEQDPISGIYCYYPYLGAANDIPTVQNSGEKIIDCSNNSRYAFTDLIRIRKISNSFKSDETNQDALEETIPCTIHRTSNFVHNTNDFDSNGNLVGLFGSNGNTTIFPFWVAYYINPYGGSIGKLEKNTTYVLEVNERLPAATLTDSNAIYTSASAGDI